MKALGDHIFYFILFIMIVMLLAGCASGPSAEPVSCRGSAFPINPSTFQTSTAQTDAGVP